MGWEIPEALRDRRTRDEPEEIVLTEPPRKKTRKTENCRFFPHCELKDKCPYNHPTRMCNKLPDCPYGDKCLFYHPKPQPPPAPVYTAPRGRPAPVNGAPPCRYGFSCLHRTNGCSFSHPLEACRFGEQCTHGNYCYYGHGVACRFGSRCTRPGCTFTHFLGKPTPPAATATQEEIDSVSATLPPTPPRADADQDASAPSANFDSEATGTEAQDGVEGDFDDLKDYEEGDFDDLEDYAEEDLV